MTVKTERLRACNVLRTMPCPYSVFYHVAVVMIIWTIIIIKCTFFIVNKLSYIIVTEVHLSAVLSPIRSFLQRDICTTEVLQITYPCFFPESQASVITKRSWKCRILLYSSWTLGLATLAEAWETLNYTRLFLGIDQWFLLVLFREGHHWRIWTAQFFQSSGGHQANFQFSYRIHPGMCYTVRAWKQRTFLASPYSVFPTEYLNAHTDCASSPIADSISYR